MNDYPNARTQILADLKAHGIGVAKDAMDPLKRIDFAQLVTIVDHEERFLRTVFVQSLVGLSSGKLAANAGTPRVNANDVKDALMMLGTAAARAAEQTLSTSTKETIKNACPYC